MGYLLGAVWFGLHRPSISNPSRGLGAPNAAVTPWSTEAVAVHLFCSSLLNGNLMQILFLLLVFWRNWSEARFRTKHHTLDSYTFVDCLSLVWTYGNNLLAFSLFSPFFPSELPKCFGILKRFKTWSRWGYKIVRTQEAARRIQCQCSNKKDSQS